MKRFPDKDKQFSCQNLKPRRLVQAATDAEGH